MNVFVESRSSKYWFYILVLCNQVEILKWAKIRSLVLTHGMAHLRFIDLTSTQKLKLTQCRYSDFEKSDLRIREWYHLHPAFYLDDDNMTIWTVAPMGAVFWRFVQRNGKLMSDFTTVDGQKIIYRSIELSDLATADG